MNQIDNWLIFKKNHKLIKPKKLKVAFLDTGAFFTIVQIPTKMVLVWAIPMIIISS